MFMFALWVMALVAGIGGGGTAVSPADVVIVLDQTVYARGDTARVTVVRQADGAAVFAFACDLFVEARCDTGWTLVVEPDCTNIRVRPTRLSTGESIVNLFAMQVPAGECHPFRFRLRYQGEDDAGYRVVTSPQFVITDS